MIISKRANNLLLQTCQVNGIDGYRYLRELLVALPRACTADDYEALLPRRLNPIPEFLSRIKERGCSRAYVKLVIIEVFLFFRLAGYHLKVHL